MFAFPSYLIRGTVKRKEGTATRKISAVTSVRHSRKRLRWRRRHDRGCRAKRVRERSRHTIRSRGTRRRGIPFPGATHIRWRDARRERNSRTRASARAISIAHARHARKDFLSSALVTSLVLSLSLLLGKQKFRVCVVLV